MPERFVIWTTLNGQEARNRGDCQEIVPTSHPHTCKVRWNGYGRRSVCASLPEVGAQCGSSARWDLRRGCRVIGVPTATVRNLSFQRANASFEYFHPTGNWLQLLETHESEVSHLPTSISELTSVWARIQDGMIPPGFLVDEDVLPEGRHDQIPTTTYPPPHHSICVPLDRSSRRHGVRRFPRGRRFHSR